MNFEKDAIRDFGSWKLLNWPPRPATPYIPTPRPARKCAVSRWNSLRNRRLSPIGHSFCPNGTEPWVLLYRWLC